MDSSARMKMMNARWLSNTVLCTSHILAGTKLASTYQFKKSLALFDQDVILPVWTGKIFVSIRDALFCSTVMTYKPAYL